MPCHRFGRVLIGHQNDYGSPPRNALGVYKRRTAMRLRTLRKKYRGDQYLARYFYNVNRCGIAHGREGAVRAEVVPSYFDIARDAVILKLLARMAIDEKRVAKAQTMGSN